MGLEGYFSKNIPKEVRGVLVGFLAFCGLIGRAIILKLGGYLFGEGRAFPFVSIALFNVAFVLLLMITICLGVFGREAPTLANVKRLPNKKKLLQSPKSPNS